MSAAPTHVSLSIADLSCPSCAVDIERHLRRLPGVADVAADLPSNRVEVSYDENRLDLQDILVTIGGAGATASLAEI